MDETRPRTLTKQIVIRIDDRLFERLQQDAEANGRTVAQSVRHRLAGSFALADAAIGIDALAAPLRPPANPSETS